MNSGSVNYRSFFIFDSTKINDERYEEDFFESGGLYIA